MQNLDVCAFTQHKAGRVLFGKKKRNSRIGEEEKERIVEFE